MTKQYADLRDLLLISLTFSASPTWNPLVDQFPLGVTPDNLVPLHEPYWATVIHGLRFYAANSPVSTDDDQIYEPVPVPDS